MNAEAGRRRGEPLLVLMAILSAWIGTRAITWEALPEPLEPMLERLSQPIAAQDAESPLSTHAPQAKRTPVISQHWPRASLAIADFVPDRRVTATLGKTALASGEVMASHQLLWLAAMAQLPVPADVAALLRSKAAPRANPTGPSLVMPEPHRWSFDSWLLLRPGESGETPAGGRPASYGASQAGAVLRYRLAPDSGHRPAVYVRATQALAAGQESELAAGIAVRPFAEVPVSLYSEMRATRHGSGEVEFRPAAFAVTELAPVPLPFGLRGEGYAQAGYVGGRFATAFADGQARVDREVARFDLAEVRAGAGIWGGAQKGAARLDIGPTASLDLRIGEAPARLALDYRWRIAGEAAPDRGIAVTLSTGF